MWCFLILDGFDLCFSFPQAAAAAQAGASVIQIFVGRIRVISFSIVHYILDTTFWFSIFKVHSSFRIGHATILVTLRLKVLSKEERIQGWLWLVKWLWSSDLIVNSIWSTIFSFYLFLLHVVYWYYIRNHFVFTSLIKCNIYYKLRLWLLGAVCKRGSTQPLGLARW